MDDSILLRRCPLCKQTKPVASFPRNKNKKDGLASRCKACQAAWRREYQKTERGAEKHRQSVTAWRKTEAGRAASARSAEKNKVVIAERKKAWSTSPTGKSLARKTKLRIKYGLTPQQWEAMLAAQGGRCAICETSQPGGRWGTFHTDHCHKTGLVRGLLCAGCNKLLGTVRDDPEMLRRAADYLDARPVRPPLPA